MEWKNKKFYAIITCSIVIISSLIIIIILLNLPTHQNSPNVEWVWVSGSSESEQGGIYGQKGVPDSDNIPGARRSMTSSMDSNGNLWLFGGFGYDNESNSGYLNDLWKFDGYNWTWISGNYSVSNLGNYGIKGVSSSENMPGARGRAVSWIDSDENFWLFGGNGYNNESFTGRLNDLWIYNTSDSTWTWVSGNYSLNNYGIYGTKGISNPQNVPGAREDCIAWHSSTGALYLFGGLGFDNDSTGHLNDLWKFQSNEWAWVSGNKTTDQPGIYGQKGISSDLNMPGARRESVLWQTLSTVWLFGGHGFDNQSSEGSLNDLWKFDGTNWTWVSGSLLKDQSGVYGQKGIANATNIPGARVKCGACSDGYLRLWLFGGKGYDKDGNLGPLNDLWKFDEGNWTWVSGNYSKSNPGIYGIKNVANSQNMPGARLNCELFPRYYEEASVAHYGLWVFGGEGFPDCSNVSDPLDNYGRLNDLWYYTIS